MERAVQIVAWHDNFREAFARINREWLLEHEMLEPADMEHLERPGESIIDRGGEILLLVENGDAVGTCGLIPRGESVELVKLGVAGHARGRGYGRMLARAAIEWARARGFARMFLLSNKRLQAASALYRSLGFLPGPVPSDVRYVSADVYMELDLAAANKTRSSGP